MAKSFWKVGVSAQLADVVGHPKQLSEAEFPAGPRQRHRAKIPHYSREVNRSHLTIFEYLVDQATAPIREQGSLLLNQTEEYIF